MTAKLHPRPHGNFCTVQKSKPASSDLEFAHDVQTQPASSRDLELSNDLTINKGLGDLAHFSKTEKCRPRPNDLRGFEVTSKPA